VSKESGEDQRAMKKISVLLLLLLAISTSVVNAETSLKDDCESFNKNAVFKYSSKGHSKAKGLNIQFSVPSYWKASEGERPNIVQKFSSPSFGDRAKIALLFINDLPPELRKLSEKEIKALLFSKDMIQSFVPEGGKIIASRQTQYDGEDGALIYHTVNTPRAGVTIIGMSVIHLFIYKKKFIYISVSYSYPLMASSLQNEISAEESRQFLDLALRIGNSIIIMNKYN